METCNDCIHVAVCGEPHIIYRCSGVCQHFKRETKLKMYNLYDSAGRKLVIDRTNGPWTPEGGYGGACHYEDKNITMCCDSCPVVDATGVCRFEEREERNEQS